MDQNLPLRDIHLPDAIVWWPPAMGWWLLLLIIVLVFLGVWHLYKRLTRKTATKSATSLLQQIKMDTTNDDLQKLQLLSAWLRRVSISVAPRHISAGLTGQAWLTYLDSNVDGTPFTTGIGQCLVDAQYRKSAPENLDISALIVLCETWLKGQNK